MRTLLPFHATAWAKLVCTALLLALAQLAAPAAEEAKSLFTGQDLSGWRLPTGEWLAAKAVALDPADPKKLTLETGVGVLVNGTNGRTGDLLTEAEFGDLEAQLEFCISKSSNSGVYFMGRYELQVYDSFGVAKDKYPGIECSGLYPRWTPARGEFEGHSPLVNASRPAGEWQTFDVVFRAPRFDAQGKKTANARFVRVRHNGQVVHENVELTGPTRSARWEDEKPIGPLLLQGDHGPVAYRNLSVKKLDLK